MDALGYSRASIYGKILAEIERVNERISTAMSTLDDLTVAIAALDNAVQSVAQNLAALEAKVTSAGALSPAQQSQLDSAVSDLSKDVSAIQNANAAAQQALGNMQPPANPPTP